MFRKGLCRAVLGTAQPSLENWPLVLQLLMLLQYGSQFKFLRDRFWLAQFGSVVHQWPNQLWPKGQSHTVGTVCRVCLTEICVGCFLQAWVIVLLGYEFNINESKSILNKVSLNRNTHKMRLCTDWLTKTLWLESSREHLCPLGTMVQYLLTQCLWEVYRI